MIEYLPLKRITALHADEIHEAVNRVVDSGWYLKGDETALFEEDYARYIGTKFCVGVANGLDALTLILRAYKEMGIMHDGDEIIVPANTYIATILSITENNLVPVLVEPRIDTLQIDDSLIEQAITRRTKAVLIVHLYGRCAYTERVGDICRHHHLLLLEDNAQAHGCCFQSSICNSQSKKTGALGHAAAHSFYPGKNLGALGDAGAVTTSDPELEKVIRSIANYGSSRKYVFDYVGRNSRIDELQAAVLRVKLKYLDAENERRRQIASLYLQRISSQIVTMPIKAHSVYHIFPVLSNFRNLLQHFLEEKGIHTAIHYPIPPHRQKCYWQWVDRKLPVTEIIHEQELSLPCHQAMTDEEIECVIDAVNHFSPC